MKRNRLSIFLLLSLAAGAASAQTTAALLTGRVTDPSGFVVPGAAVAVTNADTGIRRETATNQEGYYTLPQLEPGTYRATVTAAGFKQLTQAGLVLRVAQSARVDFALELGASSESITVQGEPPLLDATESSLGAVVDNTKLVNLPLNGRNAYDLVMLAPGAQAYARPSMPGNTIPFSNISINGGPAMTNEFLMDGIPNSTIVQSQFVVAPSIDAVQEFKVQTNSLSAEFGRTGGGVVNLTLRSGTNQLHGVVYEFLRNDKLDANNWFANRSGVPRAPFRYNQFGASAGGPIKRDRTFFFANYEGLRRIQGRTTLTTIPAPGMRQGDFSSVLSAAGQLVQIHDPLTTRITTGTTRVRDQFPGNRIPASRLDPVAQALLPYWPAPNLPGDAGTGARNFISTAGERFNTNQFNLRMDDALTARHRFFLRFSWDERQILPPNIFGNIANPSSGPQLFTSRTAGLHDTWMINPTTLATFRAGLSRLIDAAKAYGQGFDIRELGFPERYRKAQTAVQFPQIQIAGMNVSNLGFGASALGPVSNSLLNNPQNGYTGQSDVTTIRGKHTLKVGADARIFRVHGWRPANGGGSFNFTAGFTQGPDPLRAGPTSGHAFASFLIGTPSGGSINATPTQDFQSWYAALYVQEDFKLTPRLTLNFGLRWEPESHRTDRYDRLTTLDFDSPTPLRAPALGRPVVGGVRFAGRDGNPRSQQRTSWQNWAPRFGFAFSARASTVVRGGYGVFYTPRVWRGIGYGQQGYSASTPFVGSVDGFVPVNFLRDPFPGQINRPVGPADGILTDVGQAITSVDWGEVSPYVQQWNFGFQHALPGQMLVEAVYSGSKGTRLPGNLSFNQAPDSVLALGNELTRPVANPFFGQIPSNTSLGAATVAYVQLLRPYPHLTALNTSGSAVGSSIYHSMQLRSEKRFSGGVTALVSYTTGKLIDDGSPGVLSFLGDVPGYQNHNDRKSERSVSAQEVSQRLVVSYVYELPFGPGKTWLAAGGILGRVVGDWQVNGVTVLQTGQPLDLTAASNPTMGRIGSGTLRPDNSGHSARLSGPVKNRLEQYFDTSVFSQPAAWRFGNTSRTLPDVRGPGDFSFDFSAIKNTRIIEGHNLQFRAEFFSLFNRPNFGNPNQSFGSPTFGMISSAGGARVVQFGLKYYF